MERNFSWGSKKEFHGHPVRNRIFKYIYTINTILCISWSELTTLNCIVFNEYRHNLRNVLAINISLKIVHLSLCLPYNSWIKSRVTKATTLPLVMNWLPCSVHRIHHINCAKYCCFLVYHEIRHCFIRVKNVKHLKYT